MQLIEYNIEHHGEVTPEKQLAAALTQLIVHLSGMRGGRFTVDMDIGPGIDLQIKLPGVVITHSLSRCGAILIDAELKHLNILFTGTAELDAEDRVVCTGIAYEHRKVARGITRPPMVERPDWANFAIVELTRAYEDYR